MSRKPRFFCEHCGREVPRAASRCPGCGRLFASVRCPECGFVGNDTQFASGCPSCGYSAPGSIQKAAPEKRTGASRERPSFEPLPAWVYLASVGALVLAILLLVLRA